MEPRTQATPRPHPGHTHTHYETRVIEQYNKKIKNEYDVTMVTNSYTNRTHRTHNRTVRESLERVRECSTPEPPPLMQLSAREYDADPHVDSLSLLYSHSRCGSVQHK